MTSTPRKNVIPLPPRRDRARAARRVAEPANVSHGAKALWRYLNDRAGPSGECKCSLRDMAAALNVTERTVLRRIGRLKNARLVENLGPHGSVPTWRVVPLPTTGHHATGGVRASNSAGVGGDSPETVRGDNPETVRGDNLQVPANRVPEPSRQEVRTPSGRVQEERSEERRTKERTVVPEVQYDGGVHYSLGDPPARECRDDHPFDEFDPPPAKTSAPEAGRHAVKGRGLGVQKVGAILPRSLAPLERHSPPSNDPEPVRNKVSAASIDFSDFSHWVGDALKPLKCKLLPQQWLLAAEIVEGTRDDHSVRSFVKMVRDKAEDHLRTGLSHTKASMADGSVRNPGAYFTKIVQDLHARDLETAVAANRASFDPDHLPGSDPPSPPATREQQSSRPPERKRPGPAPATQATSTPLDRTGFIDCLRTTFEFGLKKAPFRYASEVLAGFDTQAVWDELRSRRPAVSDDEITEAFLERMAAQYDALHSKGDNS